MSRKHTVFALAVAVLLLLPGCHRLGLVKSPPKAPKAAEATTTTPPSTAASTTAGPSAVSVSVQNGGGVKGKGAAMAAKLQALGYTVPKATNSVLRYATTVVYYKDGHQAEAQALRNALGIGQVHKAPKKLAFNSDVLVIVGKDF